MDKRYADRWHEAVFSSDIPIVGKERGKIKNANWDDYELVMEKAQAAFKVWRKVPAPQRGEIVRLIGLALREAKDDLGRLVSLEMGKIYQEGLGEVQEMIDICDFAVGQSRQLYGLTMKSERTEHSSNMSFGGSSSNQMRVFPAPCAFSLPCS